MCPSGLSSWCLLFTTCLKCRKVSKNVCIQHVHRILYLNVSLATKCGLKTTNATNLCMPAHLHSSE